MPRKPVPDKAETVRAFLKLAKDRFLTAQSADSEERKERAIDQDFIALKQWEQTTLTDRSGRPCLTIDQINNPIRQVTNRAQQAGLAIQVRPQRDATQKEAEIRQGLVRQSEVSSHAMHAYIKALRDAAGPGLGWLRVRAEYESDSSFDQELIIEAVADPESVFYDPACVHPTWRDMRFLLVVVDMPKDEFHSVYGEDKADSLDEFSTDTDADWFPEGKVRIAEYYYVDTEDVTLVEVVAGQNGETKAVDQRTLGQQQIAPGPDGQPRTRKARRQIVKWCKFTASQILEGNDAKTEGRPLYNDKYLGKQYLPFAPVKGEELFVRGKRILRGIPRMARDSQRMFNVQNSSLIETIAIAPKSPWLIAEGQIEGHEKEWEKANQGTPATLVYKETSAAGHTVPPPMRLVQEPAIAAIQQSILLSQQNLRSVTNYYDATDPSRKNVEQSGKAIQARDEQGALGHGNFISSLALAMEHIGTIHLNWQPVIYDRPGRVAKIVGLDDQVKSVMLNQPYKQGKDGQPEAMQHQDPQQLVKQGLAEFYDMSAGQYDCVVSVGASYSTRRQETLNALMELSNAYPQIVPMIMDLVVKHMDWSGATELYERLKKLLPPQLQEDQGQVDVESLKREKQALEKIYDQLVAELHAKNAIIETDKVKTDAAIETQRLKANADIEMTRITEETKLNIAAINAQIQEQRAQREVEDADRQRQFDAGQASQQRQHERSTGIFEAGREAIQSDADRAHAMVEGDAQRQHETASQETDLLAQQEMAAQQAQQQPGPGGA